MFQIISDTSCDFTAEEAKAMNVRLVPFYIATDEETYKKEAVELPIREVYNWMVAHPGEYPKTSTPTAADYAGVFEDALKESDDVICICINAKFSSSINSALGGQEIVEDDYENARITCVDATFNTALHRLLVLECVKMRDAGMSYEDTLARMKEIIPTGRIFFTVGDLDYLIHGGRLSKVTGKVAQGLSIKPMILLEDGVLSVKGIARGRKAAEKKAIRMCTDYFNDNNYDPDDFVFCVGYGYEKNEAGTIIVNLRKAMQDNFGKDIDVHHAQIGATVGLYTGPYALGVACLKKAL